MLMFNIIVAATVFGCILIVCIFISVWIGMDKGTFSLRYLTPKAVRRRENALKMAELDNRIAFEHLKHEKLIELRQGAVANTQSVRQLVDAVEDGRRILDRPF